MSPSPAETVIRRWRRERIGLDLGAAGTSETAISILAELIASRNGREGGRLSENELPIHAPES